MTGHERASVAVLLCNYNDARYLPDSLAAICTQTVPPNELIIVDDGSTDHSLEVIKEYVGRYPFVRLIRHERNRGLMASINVALAAATADYIVWAAADDRLLAHFIERNIEILSGHRGAGVSFSRLATFQDGTETVREYRGETGMSPAFDLGAEPHFLTPQELNARLARSYLWMSGNTVLCRRDALLAAGGFRPELRWHTEWFVYWVVALRHGACVVPATLALMRERPATYSRSGMLDPVQQRQVLRALAAAIKDRQYGDVAPTFRSRPALLSPFGDLMLRVLVGDRKYWDLACRYLHWSLLHWRGLLLRRPRTCWSDSIRAKTTATLLPLAARFVGALTPNSWKD